MMITLAERDINLVIGIYAGGIGLQKGMKQCIVGVLGQNGSGQNGTDKMVWTKWYTDKMVLDKMVWTKWYGQNGMAKILRIKS